MHNTERLFPFAARVRMSPTSYRLCSHQISSSSALSFSLTSAFFAVAIPLPPIAPSFSLALTCRKCTITFGARPLSRVLELASFGVRWQRRRPTLRVGATPLWLCAERVGWRREA